MLIFSKRSPFELHKKVYLIPASDCCDVFPTYTIHRPIRFAYDTHDAERVACNGHVCSQCTVVLQQCCKLEFECSFSYRTSHSAWKRRPVRHVDDGLSEINGWNDCVCDRGLWWSLPSKFWKYLRLCMWSLVLHFTFNFQVQGKDFAKNVRRTSDITNSD